jgi:hypothetical protein
VIIDQSGSQQRQAALKGDWYTLREGVIRGPYSAEVITKYILLGRIRLDDRLSMDQQEWLEAGKVSSVVPEVMYRLSDPEEYRNYLAALRHADERVAERRCTSCNSCGECREERRGSPDRRSPEFWPDDSLRNTSTPCRLRRQSGRLRFILFAALFTSLLLAWLIPVSY